MLKIIYYVDSFGRRVSVKDEILKLKNINHQLKIFACIDFVAEQNGMVDGFISKTIRGKKFFEIRVKISRNLYRIIYIVLSGDFLVLLYMFSKKEGEQTLNKEIKNAQDAYNDFIKNSKNITKRI